MPREGRGGKGVRRRVAGHRCRCRGLRVCGRDAEQRPEDRRASPRDEPAELFWARGLQGWEQSLGVWSAEGRTERTGRVTWAQMHVTGTRLCSVHGKAAISAQILWQLVCIYRMSL